MSYVINKKINTKKQARIVTAGFGFLSMNDMVIQDWANNLEMLSQYLTVVITVSK